MQSIVYSCDKCGKILSNSIENINEQHLSINFEPYSGWVKKNDKGIWRHFTEVIGKKQFCGTKCLADYFSLEKK